MNQVKLSHDVMTESIEKMLVDISEGEYEAGQTSVNFLVEGLIDSFGFVQLILALENTFKFKIDEEDQLDPRLRSVDGLVELSLEKLGD